MYNCGEQTSAPVRFERLTVHAQLNTARQRADNRSHDRASAEAIDQLALSSVHGVHFRTPREEKVTTTRREPTARPESAPKLATLGGDLAR
jgi:hypothetical protein